MKRTIFISGIQKELAQERRAIKAYVEGDPLLRKFFDVFLFEDLPASDRRPDRAYLDEVDRCGLYVGIYGAQYGNADDQGISPTEREFDRATAKGKVRLIFIKGTDDKGRHPKMLKLIRKAGAQLIRRRFSGTADLNAGLYASIVDYLDKTGGLRTKPFDAAACPGAKLSDLSREKLTDFLARAQAERGYALGPKSSTHKALAHLNLIDGRQPSHAAVLLFGKKPQRFLIPSEVKCMHFHGTEISKPIPSYQIYKGTLFEMVDQAVDFVMAKIARAVIPRDGQVTSDVEYELPYKAVREAIVNAVTHRDYASNASVQVMLFVDRLEVWNPGELPPPLTPDKLRKPHASIPRNPLIADPMFLATYAEKAGSGILDMMRLCHRAHLREPAFRQDGDQFVQTLWRRPKPAVPEGTEQVTEQVTVQVTVQVTEQVKRLLHALAKEPAGTRGIMRSIRLRHRPTLLNDYLKPAADAGLVEMTQPDSPRSPTQQYRLTAKGREWIKKKPATP